jgi:hypothetical protein
MSASSLHALEAAGWEFSQWGKIMNGQPQSTGIGGSAYFKHSRPLEAADVLKMRVQVGTYAFVGLCGQAYDVEKYGETYKSTAWMDLHDGTTRIFSGLSQDAQDHSHLSHVGPYIPKAPFDLALRCEAVSNVPQIQFNDDNVWHNFAPNRVGGSAYLYRCRQRT